MLTTHTVEYFSPPEPPGPTEMVWVDKIKLFASSFSCKPFNEGNPND